MNHQQKINTRSLKNAEIMTQSGVYASFPVLQRQDLQNLFLLKINKIIMACIYKATYANVNVLQNIITIDKQALNVFRRFYRKTYIFYRLLAYIRIR